MLEEWAPSAHGALRNVFFLRRNFMNRRAGNFGLRNSNSNQEPRQRSNHSHQEALMSHLPMRNEAEGMCTDFMHNFYRPIPIQARYSPARILSKGIQFASIGITLLRNFVYRVGVFLSECLASMFRSLQRRSHEHRVSLFFCACWNCIPHLYLFDRPNRLYATFCS